MFHLNNNKYMAKKKKVELVEEVKDELFTFPEIIMQVLDGDKITRKSWPEGMYAYMFGGLVKVHTSSRDFDMAIIEGDIVATDWINLSYKKCTN